MSLCRNRLEGFGPRSTIHENLPTSCFLDTIVVPLPTWAFVLLLLALLPQRMNPTRQRRASSILKPTKPIENERAHYVDAELAPRPAVHTRILTALYYLIVAAMVALVSIEIAQLSSKDIGIGLLPFSYVGFVAVLANRLQWKTRMARIENAIFWVLMGIVLTLKVAATVIESDSPPEGSGEGSRIYPGGNGIVVISVMVGFSFALAVLEFAGWTGLGRETW